MCGHRWVCRERILDRIGPLELLRVRDPGHRGRSLAPSEDDLVGQSSFFGPHHHRAAARVRHLSGADGGGPLATTGSLRHRTHHRCDPGVVGLGHVGGGSTAARVRSGHAPGECGRLLQVGDLRLRVAWVQGGGGGDEGAANNGTRGPERL